MPSILRFTSALATPGLLTRSTLPILAALALLLAAGPLTTAYAQRPNLRSGSSDRSSSERPGAPARSSNPARPTPAAASSKSFSATSFSPRGPVQAGAIISVTFNADVITSDALATGDLPSSVFSFQPSIEGRQEWENLRQVRFIPAKALKSGTEYIVRINPLLTSAAGQKLADPPEYRFQTPPLTLKTARQTHFSSTNRASITLTFSDPINPTDLRKYLTLKSGDAPIQWKLQSDVATPEPVIETDPMTTDSLVLVLEPGLRGVSGPLGLRNRTEVKVRLDFKMVATRVSGQWASGKPMLKVEFSSDPSVASAGKFITVEPAVKSLSFSSGEDALLISGDFEAEKRYTVNIQKGFRGRDDDKVMLAPTRLSTWMPAMSPFLDLPQSGGHLGTRGRMKLRVKSGALTTVTVTARRVFDNNLPHYEDNSGSYYSVRNYGQKVAEKSYPVAPRSTGAQLTEVDLRDLLGTGATGIFGIEVTGETSATVSSDSNEYHYGARYSENTVINLSNLGIVAKTGPGEMTVFVAALDTAQPLPGIHVQVFSNRFQLMGEADTDASGLATVKPLEEANEDAEPMMVIARSADKTEVATLNLRENLTGLEQFENSGRDYMRQGYEAFVTPERGAYRPGETAHVTGFLRGKDAAPPGSPFPVEVVVQRPDGKKMTPILHTPTATGVINLDVTVPSYAPTGYYQVEVRMPGTKDEESEDE